LPQQPLHLYTTVHLLCMLFSVLLYTVPWHGKNMGQLQTCSPAACLYLWHLPSGGFHPAAAIPPVPLPLLTVQLKAQLPQQALSVEQDSCSWTVESIQAPGSHPSFRRTLCLRNWQRCPLSFQLSTSGPYELLGATPSAEQDADRFMWVDLPVCWLCDLPVTSILAHPEELHGSHTTSLPRCCIVMKTSTMPSAAYMHGHPTLCTFHVATNAACMCVRPGISGRSNPRPMVCHTGVPRPTQSALPLAPCTCLRARQWRRPCAAGRLLTCCSSSWSGKGAQGMWRRQKCRGSCWSTSPAEHSR
jgi:hypothetical protein